MSEEGKSDWMLVAKVGYATLALLATGICAWFAVVTAEEHHAGAAMITSIIVAAVLLIFLNGSAAYLNIADSGRARRLREELKARDKDHEQEISALNKKHAEAETSLKAERDAAQNRAVFLQNEIAVKEHECVTRIAKDSTAAPLPELDVVLEPTRGKNSLQYLIVTNKGEKQNFHAQCQRLEDFNGRRILKSYQLTWEGGAIHRPLSRDESGNLVIAIAGQDRQNELEYIALRTMTGGQWESMEFERWNIGDNPTDIKYRLNITVIGEETQTSKSQKFILRPGKSCAMEMTVADELQPDSTGIADSDPRIYVDIEDRDIGSHTYLHEYRTVFKLTNQGASEARNVMLTFPLEGRTVAFEAIDLIYKEDTAESIPTIEGERYPACHNLLSVLSNRPIGADWKPERQYQFTVTYQNWNGTKEFAMPATMTYASFADTIKKQSGLGVSGSKKIITVTHGKTEVRAI